MALTLTPLRRRLLVATAVLLVGALVAVQVVLRSDAVRERVRARAGEVLEARLGGEAHLGDWRAEFRPPPMSPERERQLLEG